MDKFREIRPIVLGLLTRNNKLLVSEGYDEVKDQYFYRCLGGGIEFWERSDEALRREFQEEIGKDIIIKDFLGIAENIFTFNGKKGHELVLFYSIDIDDKDYQEEYIMDEDGEEDRAVWIDIDSFKKGEKILYPERVFDYL